MSHQMMFGDLFNATSLPESASGQQPSELPDGQTTARSGADPAHASLSARQAKERGLTTSGTYGPIGNGSSRSAALQSSLGNRLRARTAFAGSILYRLISKGEGYAVGAADLCAAGFGMDWRSTSWREWLQRAVRHCPDPVVGDGFAILPSGLIKALSSADTISGNGSTLSPWPTPQSSDEKWRYSTSDAAMRRLESGKQMSCEATAHLTAGWPTPTTKEKGGGATTDPDKVMQRIQGPHSNDLQDFAQISGWPTARAEDAESAGMRHSRGVADTLTAVSSVAGWVTPSTRDWKDSPGMTAQRDDGGSREDQLPRQAFLTGWATPVATEIGNSEESYLAMKANMKSGPRKAITHPSIQAKLSAWPTATTTDAKGSRRHGQMINGQEGTTITDAAVLSGWPTPMAGTPAQNGNNEAGNTDSSRRTEALAGREIQGSGIEVISNWGPARLTADGRLLTGSSAGTVHGGQLNPELPRWLMRLPVAWGSCAPLVTASILKRQRASSKS
jgi:hypothetical protein